MFNLRLYLFQTLLYQLRLDKLVFYETLILKGIKDGFISFLGVVVLKRTHTDFTFCVYNHGATNISMLVICAIFDFIITS